jgi:hypothetical protein
MFQALQRRNITVFSGNTDASRKTHEIDDARTDYATLYSTAT